MTCIIYYDQCSEVRRRRLMSTWWQILLCVDFFSHSYHALWICSDICLLYNYFVFLKGLMIHFSPTGAQNVSKVF